MCIIPGCSNPNMSGSRVCTEHNPCRDCGESATPPYNRCDKCRCTVPGCRHPQPCKKHQCKFCKVTGDTVNRMCPTCSKDRCPACFALHCIRHYCSCGEFCGGTRCAKCYCSCSEKLPVSGDPTSCPKCRCMKCHERLSGWNEKKCEQCHCKMTGCKNYHNGNGYCDDHTAECCRDTPHDVVHVSNSRAHFGNCPTVWKQCNCPLPSSNCVQVVRVNSTSDVCDMCESDNRCIVCRRYHTTGLPTCAKCTMVKKCPVCSCKYKGDYATAACIEHESDCVNCNWCHISMRRDSWLNLYGLGKGLCLIDSDHRDNFTPYRLYCTVFRMWARVNVLGKRYEMPELSQIPTVDVTMMSTGEFNTYVSVLRVLKTNRDIAFAMGIILKLPKDIFLMVVGMIKK